MTPLGWPLASTRFWTIAVTFPVNCPSTQPRASIRKVRVEVVNPLPPNWPGT